MRVPPAQIEVRHRGRAVVPIRGLALAAALVLAGVGDGGAHGLLERAEPRAGSTARVPPRVVRLWFAGAIEPGYSRIEVFDANGNRADMNDSAVDPASRTLLTVSLPALPAGRYRVVWRVLSIDSHLTDGELTFSVAP
ncbi:MAG TPA: copper resistance CopC family protein [Methylomirabilota bacterium]|nr:copper resistance CopC family protein [Methylomirabilota bacterium]